jgi:hypothetical protein
VGQAVPPARFEIQMQPRPSGRGNCGAIAKPSGAGGFAYQVVSFKVTICDLKASTAARTVGPVSMPDADSEPRE